MCATCGCDSEVKVSIHKVEPTQNLNWNEVQFVKPVDIPTPMLNKERKEIKLEQDILLKNNLRAERNRGYFLAKNILALNLVSSPGSGKTSLLERTLHDLKEDGNYCVIEGDQQTSNDADRIAATKVPVVQINTGKGCHLDADMIWNAVQQLNPANNTTLFIENIGNLVCPAMFDLGEQKRVVIISTTEGEDKPLKYPDMFATSQLCIINKIDLLPYVKFEIDKVKQYARQINPAIEFVEVSCTSGEGLTSWYDWLQHEQVEKTFVKV
jgi:hydrogenase nickel incorporation protein HypB